MFYSAHVVVYIGFLKFSNFRTKSRITFKILLLTYLHSLHLIYPPHIPAQPASHLSPTYTYTACTSFIPHIYLHSLHLIYSPHIPSHLSPSYTYTAFISLIPQIYLHSLHLIYSPHTPSHLSPSYTYTACISFIPHIYLLIYPPSYTYTAYISFIPPHIPTQPASHLFPTYTFSFIPLIYLHSLHLTYPPHIPAQPASHLFPSYTNIALHLSLRFNS